MPLLCMWSCPGRHCSVLSPHCVRQTLFLHAGIAVHKLAKLYKQLADTDRAAHFYTFHLKRLDEEQSQGQDVAEALLFLATYNKVSI